MDALGLTDLLVTRFLDLVPPGFLFETDSGMLRIKADIDYAYTGEVGLPIAVRWDISIPYEERVREQCEIALDDLRDIVDEATATPWPGEGRDLPRREP